MPFHSKFSFTCDFRTQQYNYKLTKIIEVNCWAKIFPSIQERMFSLFGAYHIIHKKNYQKFFIKTIHWFEINLYWYYAPFLEIKKKSFQNRWPWPKYSRHKLRPYIWFMFTCLWFNYPFRVKNCLKTCSRIWAQFL